MWKVCASLVKNAGNSGKNIINSDDNFYPSTEKNKEKLAKKRKIDSNKLQVNRTESIRIPCKKRRVFIIKIKKRGGSVICESKNSIRCRLAEKSEKKQKFKDSAVTYLYCSAIVSQPSKRKNQRKIRVD